MNLKNYKNKIGQPILVYTHLNMSTRFPIFEGKFELLTMGFNSYINSIDTEFLFILSIAQPRHSSL